MTRKERLFLSTSNVALSVAASCLSPQCLLRQWLCLKRRTEHPVPTFITRIRHAQDSPERQKAGGGPYQTRMDRRRYSGPNSAGFLKRRGILRQAQSNGICELILVGGADRRPPSSGAFREADGGGRRQAPLLISAQIKKPAGD